MSTEYEGLSWNTSFKAVDDTKLLKTHLDEYARMAQTCVDKVAKLWNEIGLPRTERQKEFDEIASAVRNVWSLAVDRAEKKKRERQQEIDDAVSEIYRIKEELGDCTRESRKQGIEGLLKLELIVGTSLHTRYEAIQELLRDWRSQRSKREREFMTLQAEINNLKVRFGHVVIAPSLAPQKSEISLANLQELSDELEQCKGEKLRRERELAALLSKLRSASLPLGENDIEIAADAHPSLRFYREALPGHFSLVRPSFSNQPGLQRNIRPEDVELDLSDLTFAKLEEKILEMYDLRAAREKQTVEVARVLKYLWDILEIPEDNLERGMLMRCLEGPTRLHVQSIERCKNEVRQLETTKARQLWELIDKTKEELEEVCAETMLPVPQLCPILDMQEGSEHGTNPVGKISDALTKLKKMIVGVREESAKREPIILQITQLERTREEVAWLSEYELDADRYKGRDLSKKLDRALKAGRMRDKLPEMIKRLKKAVCKWEQEERRPFIYQGQDYNVVLENMQSELSLTQQRDGKVHRRGGNRRAPSRSAFTPPPPVNSHSPQPSLDSNPSASIGARVEPKLGSGGPLNTVQKLKVYPSGVRTAPLDTKHAPDGEQKPVCGRQSWGSGSTPRPPRACYSRSSGAHSSLIGTPLGSNGYSSRHSNIPSRISNCSGCGEDLEFVDEEAEPDKNTNGLVLDAINSKTAFSFRSDNQPDLQCTGVDLNPEQRGGLRKSSPYGDGRRGSNRSTPNHTTSSSGSSRISISIENTDGKPC